MSSGKRIKYLFLLLFLALYFLWATGVPEDPYAGTNESIFTIGIIALFIPGSIALPLTVVAAFFFWNLFVRPKEHNTARKQTLRWVVGLAVCAIAVIWPVYDVYRVVANPNPPPGSEFFIILIPIYAIPVLYGLLGLRRLLKEPKTNATPATSVDPNAAEPALVAPVKSFAMVPTKRGFGTELIRAMIFAAILLVVWVVLSLGYSFYQMRTY